MEAVAALGVAGNVLQFLDFGQKLCSTSREIHRAATGASTANAESETLLRDFIDSVDTVSSDLKQYRSALDATSSQVSGPGVNALHDVVDDCKGLAAELLARFEELRGQGKPGRWKSLATGVKCMWKEKELQDLQDRLTRYRLQLDWRVMISLRENMDLLVSRQKDQFEDFQTAITEKLTEVLQEQVSTLPRWPAAMDDAIRDYHSKTIAALTNPQEEARKHSTEGSTPLESVISSPESSDSGPVRQSVQFPDGYALRYATALADSEARAWESLSFEVMTDREDDIAEAELATFDWIFEQPQSEQRPWSNFQEWLSSGESLYWINGKAGSGKSTLMKHVSNHKRCREMLAKWAGDQPLVTASFFFWYNGSDLQKSQIGLLRSLLYQCLTDHRELIPLVLADTARVKTADLSHHWSLPRLKSAFVRLLEQKKTPLKICLFIDGLDEYTGSHSEFVELLKSVAGSAHIKVCVSSRPLLVFERAFGSFPGLMLQNLTFRDIETYVRNRLGTHERMRELETEEPELAPQLVSEIVSKASGVFLWVKLVVYSLLEGLGNYDRGADLQRRLEELPEDLEDLYWHMLDRVKPLWYLEESFRLLLIVKRAFQPLNILQLSFAAIQDPRVALESNRNEISLERQRKECESMAGRVKSRCLGLIEIIGSLDTEPFARRVQFLHKSVSDFLDTSKAQSRIKSCFHDKEFVPEVDLMRSTLLELKTVETRLSAYDFDDEGRVKRGAWFNDARPVVVNFMRYAGWAEEKTGLPQTELVDQVDLSMTALWKSVRVKSTPERSGTAYHWSLAKRRLGDEGIYGLLTPAPVPMRPFRLSAYSSLDTSQPTHGFVAFAQREGLHLYVTAKTGFHSKAPPPQVVLSRLRISPERDQERLRPETEKTSHEQQQVGTEAQKKDQNKHLQRVSRFLRSLCE